MIVRDVGRQENGNACLIDPKERISFLLYDLRMSLNLIAASWSNIEVLDYGLSLIVADRSNIWPRMA